MDSRALAAEAKRVLPNEGREMLADTDLTLEDRSEPQLEGKLLGPEEAEERFLAVHRRAKEQACDDPT